MEPEHLPNRQWRLHCLWRAMLTLASFSLFIVLQTFYLRSYSYSPRSTLLPSRRDIRAKSITSLDPQPAGFFPRNSGVSQMQADANQTFQAYEDTVLKLSCGSKFIAIKTARWFSSSNACSVVRDCAYQLKLLCDARFSCQVSPSAQEGTTDNSGVSSLNCGNVCSTIPNAQRRLDGEYECTEEEGQPLPDETLGKRSLGNVVIANVTYDTVEDAATNPTSSEIAAAGGVMSFFTKQAARGRNLITFTDTDVSGIRDGVDNASLAMMMGSSFDYFRLTSMRLISRIWFTKGAFAVLFETPTELNSDAAPAVLATVGSTEYGVMMNPDNKTHHWEYADFACGVADAFAISIGLRPRHAGFISPKIICTNPSSTSCANVDVVNEAIEKQRPGPVMLQGIACNSNGNSFTLLFADGTVLAFGDPNRGGIMSPAAVDALSTFDMTRPQRVKKIVTSRGATAVLLSRGSVYAWGEEQYGGALPDPEPTGVTDLVSNDVGFAALTGDGTVFTWGKGLSVPARLARESVKIVKLYGERTCFAAFDEKGGIYVWGLGSDRVPFCSEGFSGAGEDSILFDDVKSNVSEGITEVRFSGHAAVATRKPPLERGPWEIIGWGTADLGGKIPNYAITSARKGVKGLFAGDDAFVLVNKEGDMVAWGSPESGGEGWNNEALAALLTSGEAYAWGKGGAKMLTSTTRAIEGAEKTGLERGLYVLGGSGEGELFVGLVGYPCVPSNWGEWSECKDLCEGIKQRDRDIDLGGTRGKCAIFTTQAEKCRGPKYGTAACPNTVSEQQASASSDTSTSSSGLSVGSIAGCIFAGICILGIVGFMIHTFARGNA